MAEISPLIEKQDIRNEVYDAEPILAIPAELQQRLDTLETMGGPGYEIACDYQNHILDGYSPELAAKLMIHNADDALGELGVA